jgi:SAM-dependent methyltransferase
MTEVTPYAELARWYNPALGNDSFRQTCRAFERLVARHAIAFRSAADLGCGTGLFACYLAGRFRVPVFAVDRSPEMLAVARRSCRRPSVRFFSQDIRQLHLPLPVDLATANFDTINHLMRERDLDQAFERIAANLRPGGHLLFDLLTPALPLPGGRTVGRRLRASGCDLRQFIGWNPVDRVIRVTIVRRAPQGVTVERHHERAHDAEHVCRLLRARGLIVRGLFDAASLRPAGRSSPRVIVVARRAIG